MSMRRARAVTFLRNVLQCFRHSPATKAAVIAALICSGCASLPEVSQARNHGDAVRFEGSRGPLSKEESATILERLKAGSGETSILDRHVALEQSVVETPLVVGNHVTLLKDGPATYRAMFAAIRKARDHIHLETYIFEDDEVGQKFSELLIAKQKQGVQVAILYDSVGAINASRSFFDRLEENGVRILEFNPINPLAGKSKSAPDHRAQRKLLVVDGRIAFLGGINISSVYAASRPRRSKKAALKSKTRRASGRTRGP